MTILFSELEYAINNNVWLTSFEFKDDFSLQGKENQGRNKDSGARTGYFIVNEQRSGTDKFEEYKSPALSTVLQGIAISNKDLSLFLEHLSTSEYFSDVNLKYSRKSANEEIPVVEFAIETYLNEV